MLKVTFGDRVNTGGGLCWYIEHNQAEKLHQLGAVQVRDQFFKPCIDNKYGENSSNKALLVLKDTQFIINIITELCIRT